MRRLLPILLVALLLAPAAAAQASLKTSLTRYMRLAGSSSGAYVVNLSTGSKVFAWKAGTPRILASNTKLFTSSAALARFGVDGTLATEVLGDGRLDEDGVWRGDLYLRGGGDPTFGSGTYARRFYGGGATVQQLAKLLDRAGIERVTGRVYGDESRHDSLRGGPDSGYGVSIWVGPLSALSYNRGFANEGGSAFQLNPPAFAAARLDDALEARGIPVRRSPQARRAPGGSQRARDRRVASDGARREADEQAVRQLLRRAAGQGRRHAGQRPRHHLRGRSARRRASRAASALGRSSWTGRGCRAATARRPTGWCAC